MRLLTDARPAEKVALAVLLVFTLMAVGGYGYYGLRPENLPQHDLALWFFPLSFQLFAQIHILISAVALAVVLVGRTGTRWLPALGLVWILSFLAEHIGTGYGIPFGGYGYTGLLGYKVGGRVPALIPLSWFLMALPSWVLARALLGKGGSPISRVLLGALGLVAWDLALDPAMSWLTAYWRWEETGPYYGMPWLNLAGWYLTGLILLGVLEALSGRARLGELPVGWTAAYYATVALLPLGMLAVAGAWLGVVVTLVGTAAWVVGTRAVGRVLEPRDEAAPSPSPASLPPRP